MWTPEARVYHEEELVRRTQELMDAVAAGNQEPWKKYFADDATYLTKKGRAMDKAALVKDVSRCRWLLRRHQGAQSANPRGKEHRNLELRP